ncbi:MAG: hypothetical protein ACLURV_01370 [Gallintestinimicrobium sp.]
MGFIVSIMLPLVPWFSDLFKQLLAWAGRMLWLATGQFKGEHDETSLSLRRPIIAGLFISTAWRHLRMLNKQ